MLRAKTPVSAEYSSVNWAMGSFPELYILILSLNGAQLGCYLLNYLRAAWHLELEDFVYF
ncbi:Uncharacterised protein [Sphingobacterium daejeonense]|nr:Uncharacterised protein [Sphingobacterium daejeonense]